MVVEPIRPHIWKIYKVTCVVTGRAYIGLTKRSVQRRWRFHVYNAQNGHSARWGMIIGRAILKHGAENFIVETLSTHSALVDASAAEREAIRTHHTMKPLGYNVALGGHAVRGHRRGLRPEEIERVGAMWRGKTFPVEMRRKMSEAAKRKIFTPQHRDRLGAVSRGKPNVKVAIAALLSERATGIARAKGVRPTPGGRWMVRIKIKGRTLYVGTYTTIEEAVAAYRGARDARLKELGHQAPFC